MLQAHAKDIRSRLRLTTSALVIATAGLVSSAAYADVTVASGGSYDLTDLSAVRYIVPNGVVGEVHYDMSPVVYAGSANLTAPWNASLTGGSNASSISVQNGGTVRIYNPWYWAVFTDMIDASAGSTVIVENHGDMNFFGTNYFNGDLWLRFDPGEAWSPPVVNLGQDWNRASNFFGTTSRIIMDNTTAITFWEPHSVTNTISMFTTTGGGAATVNFGNGTMIVNGVNTTLAPFAGNVNVSPGATFMVGDASHPNAVFGDPAASAVTITINQAGGTVGTLKGYGTIYGNVTNNSLVAPGGTAGTAGTLAIHGNFTQSAMGELVTEVTPTGVSQLTVTGTATLAGTLLLKIDDGNYTAPGLFNILTAGTKVGSFNSINVQGDAAFVGAISTTNGYQVVVESQNSAQTFAHQVSAARFNATELNRALLDRLGAMASEGKHLWLTPYGSIDNIGRSGLGYNNMTYGVRGGAEYRSAWKGAVIGIAASYGSGSMDTKGESTTADSTIYNAAVYGGMDLAYARVDGTLFIGGIDSSIARDLGSLGTLNSTPGGSSYGGSVQVSRTLFHDWVTPYVAGYFSHIHLNGEGETGNDNLALAFDSINKNFMAVDLGARVHVIRQERLKLDVNLAVEHDFSDRGETVGATFANITGSSADYVWDGDAENALVVGAHLSHSISEKVEVFARANGQFSLYRRAGDFAIGAKFRF